MAPAGPYYMPGLDEQYEQVKEGVDVRPVRNDIAQPGQEIVTLRHWKIQKGGFERFFEASRDGVWPYFEKIGARVIGQWKVIYPPPPACERIESPDYDEVLMMARYAGYAHWQATRQPVDLGGDGPDYDKLQEARAVRQSLMLDSSVRFMQGYMYHSPPVFMPGLDEKYRLMKD
jgi:hypothetical protein